MQRFVSKRSSSSVDLASSSLPSQTEAARQTLQLAAAPGTCSCRRMSSTMSSRNVSAYSGRAGGDQERPQPDRSHTRRSLTPALLVPPRPPQPLHSLKTPQSPRRPQRARLAPRHVPPVEDRAAMGQAVLHGSGRATKNMPVASYGVNCVPSAMPRMARGGGTRHPSLP